jgi:hypothetical protein
MKKKCQEWDSNPYPFGPVPETGALDQLGHLDLCWYCKNLSVLILRLFDVMNMSHELDHAQDNRLITSLVREQI